LSELSEATGYEVESVAGVISPARILTVVSWRSYQVVYVVKSMDISGTVATVNDQMGYSVAVDKTTT
jgi:hypothetical protein